MMNKYLLFAGKHYEPDGGWLDFIGSYESYEAAAEEGVDYPWFQVVDIDTGEIIND